MPSQFERFTEKARRALSLAPKEAERYSHNYIGSEHLLLGLIHSEVRGGAAKILTDLQINLSNVRSAVAFIIGRGERQPPGEIGLTPRAKKVIELAVDESRRLSHRFVGTEHLLIGIMREGEGVAAGVLESVGVSLDKLRAQMETLAQPEGQTLSRDVQDRIPEKVTIAVSVREVELAFEDSHLAHEILRRLQDAIRTQST